MNLKEFVAILKDGSTVVFVAKDLGHALYQCQEFYPSQLLNIYPLMEW